MYPFRLNKGVFEGEYCLSDYIDIFLSLDQKNIFKGFRIDEPFGMDKINLLRNILVIQVYDDVLQWDFNKLYKFIENNPIHTIKIIQSYWKIVDGTNSPSLRLPKLQKKFR